MLQSQNRLTRALFKPLLESRHFRHSELFSLRVAPSKAVRFGVSVSKKVSKSAVVRNRIRRRVYSVIREIIPDLAPALYLIVAKSGAEKLGGAELFKELETLLSSTKV